MRAVSTCSPSKRPVCCITAPTVAITHCDQHPLWPAPTAASAHCGHRPLRPVPMLSRSAASLIASSPCGHGHQPLRICFSPIHRLQSTGGDLKNLTENVCCGKAMCEFQKVNRTQRDLSVCLMYILPSGSLRDHAALAYPCHTHPLTQQDCPPAAGQQGTLDRMAIPRKVNSCDTHHGSAGQAMDWDAPSSLSAWSESSLLHFRSSFRRCAREQLVDQVLGSPPTMQETQV